jgi:thiamine biosynthesis lipoprotein ApbE
MKFFRPSMSRRSFLGTSAVVPLAILSRHAPGEYRYQYDHVIGTSLDVAVRARNESTAREAEQAVRSEIRRLAAVLSTRDPNSAINRAFAGKGTQSRALAEVLSAYDFWERQTRGALSLRPEGPHGSINVDALGKAYIIDRAAEIARQVSGAESILLNIGGDIRLIGGSCEVDVTDPAAAFDNAEPLTRVWLEDEAIATSGTYARGAHLLDPRTGRAASTLSSATVIARDAVTANALATAACIEGPEAGMALIENTLHAEAILVTSAGVSLRSSGFARRERSRVIRAVAMADWPAGFRVTLSIRLLEGTGRGAQYRPYVGVWVEDPANSNKLIRVIAFWANDSRYYNELSILFNRAGRSRDRMDAVARATRPSGKYDLMWDGLNDQMAPVPTGTYRIVVETHRENGSYGKQSGLITCEGEPSEVKISGTANFEPITVQYGPRTNAV